MIVDFQHHFTPQNLNKAGPRRPPRFFRIPTLQRTPSCTIRSLLYDPRREHVRMMDVAGVDAAWLTSTAAGSNAPDLGRHVAFHQRQGEEGGKGIIGRFGSFAHAHPTPAAPTRSRRWFCYQRAFGFQGVTICSELTANGSTAPAIEPFLGRSRQARHVRVRASGAQAQPPEQFDAPYDTAARRRPRGSR